MLFTATTKDAAPAIATTANVSARGTQDAHRTFCDLFEAEDNNVSDSSTSSKFKHVPNGAAADVAATPGGDSAASAATTPVGGTGTGGTPTTAKSSFFEGAATSIRRDLIGRNTLFRTPYGMKPLVYSDWTATGRAVGAIEVRDVVEYGCRCPYVGRKAGRPWQATTKPTSHDRGADAPAAGAVAAVKQEQLGCVRRMYFEVLVLL